MKEDRATPPENARAPVEIQQANQVINTVVAPQSFRPCPKGKNDLPVVAMRFWIVAPAVLSPDCATVGAENRPGVGASQPIDNHKPAERRNAIAFAPFGPYTVSTNGAKNVVRPHRKKSEARASRHIWEGSDGNS